MTDIKVPFLAVFVCMVLSLQGCSAFLSAGPIAQSSKAFESRLFLIEDLSILGEECTAVSDGDAGGLLESLRKRKDELDIGIGKRYVCRTQKGFLNVHKEPGEPFNPYNVVHQLKEGDIVTSTGPPRGGWIRHDNGGWSISKYNGFTWLEELKE
ncbi:expressed unknown protein [Seminavis robusta]|uniref:SH3 domain-containing protein n=1 Tax=Seminavis robusta TaxID=568900 RepID=A0A9N8E2J1_9STRA|nr:expressed unknown protein [Seminavis robusta]|eukprot:Sro440_g143490.1 n/a (154) ;mRNA; r:38082-38543